MRKRDKRAKRITCVLCSRSCYTWVPNYSPLTLSYIAKQREWYMTKRKGSLEVSSCMCGSQHGVHGSAVDYWLLTKGCCPTSERRSESCFHNTEPIGSHT